MTRLSGNRFDIRTIVCMQNVLPDLMVNEIS